MKNENRKKLRAEVKRTIFKKQAFKNPLLINNFTVLKRAFSLENIKTKKEVIKKTTKNLKIEKFRYHNFQKLLEYSLR